MFVGVQCTTRPGGGWMVKWKWSWLKVPVCKWDTKNQCMYVVTISFYCSLKSIDNFHIKERYIQPRTTDTQWRHKSKISEKLGRCGRQNMLRPFLKIWEWEWIFGRAVKAISSLGVRSLCIKSSDNYYIMQHSFFSNFSWMFLNPNNFFQLKFWFF